MTLFVLCFVAAYKKLWLQNPRHTVSDYPSFFLSLWLFKLSQLIEDSVFFRSALVIQGVILLYTLTSLRVVSIQKNFHDLALSLTNPLQFACDIAKLEVEIIVSNLLNEHPLMTCFMPWVCHAFILNAL